jgi:predicted  nucleic acid-binding Zn-ribbon protein
MSKKVMSKIVSIEKQELSTEKVELATEFKKFSQKAQSIYLDARNLAQKDLMDLRDKMEDGERKLSKLSSELNSEISRVSKQAKSIGVDIKKTTVYKNMTKAIQEVMSYEDSFKKAITKTKGFKL